MRRLAVLICLVLSAFAWAEETKLNAAGEERVKALAHELRCLVCQNQTIADSVTIELHNSVSPFAIAQSMKAVLRTDGTTDIIFPFAVFNQSYFIVIRHRNTIETWSKTPVLFDSFVKNFDFTN